MVGRPPREPRVKVGGLVAHTLRFVLRNPSWPTDWKQQAVLLAHGHYMRTGDAQSLVLTKVKQ